MHDQFSGDNVVLDNAIGYWVHRVYQATRNRLCREFRKEGVELTPEQWIVLVRLWESDGRTQTELGESTYHDRPTMSRMLAVMEKHGLVERRAAPDNARIWRVHLTPRGKALQHRLVPVARRIVEETRRGIPRGDLETTRATLRKMFANADAAGE